MGLELPGPSDNGQAYCDTVVDQPAKFQSSKAMVNVIVSIQT